MKYVIFFALALLTTTCANNQTDSSSDRSTAEVDNDLQSTQINTEQELAAIEELRNGFSIALKEGRYEEIGNLVSTEVRTVGPGGDEWSRMYALGQERGRFPYDSIRMRPTETVIMNDSMAYDWGNSSVYYTDDEGVVVELRNSFLVILKKENGSWKLHREVGSSRLE